jgi:16S rRNA G527 N7-methylase RsmG
VDVVLIERREKRALFLERTSRALGAGNVAVLPDDLGHVSRETPPDRAFDLVTTVAVGDPARLAADVERMLRPGGRFASTVSREAVLRTGLGAHLELLDRIEGKFGCYAIYRRGV